VNQPFKPVTQIDVGDFASHDGYAYPRPWLKKRLIPLVTTAYQLAELLDSRGIQFISAYRSPSWNEKVKGAHDSEHMQGRALDVNFEGVTPIRAFAVAKAFADKLGIGGLGLYDHWIHMDIRPHDPGQLITWERRKSWAQRAVQEVLR